MKYSIFSTGDLARDNLIKMILANPNLCGGVVACFLDNTLPGITTKCTHISGYIVFQYLLLSKKNIQHF